MTFSHASNGFAVGAVLFLAIIGTATAQHPNCTAGENGSGTVCHDGGFILPANFDVSKLDPNQPSLTIRTGTNSPNQVIAHAVPFPALQKLLDVYFHDFNFQSNSVRFPLNHLLQNNKQVRSINLYRVNLGQLNETVFRGFTELETLIIADGSRIESIDVNTFSQLGLLPSGAVVHDFKPKLSQLAIRNSDYSYRFSDLDWSVLAPISESLKKVSFKGNSLRSSKLTASIPFVLTNAKHINLEMNSLTDVPAAVYNTWNYNLPLEIRLYSNRFCEQFNSFDCSCCELADFTAWLNRHDQLDSVKSFWCGRYAQTQFHPLLAISDPDLHSHCQQSKPTEQLIAPPTPAPQPGTSTEAAEGDQCNSVTAPLKVTCAKGVISRPTIEFDLLEATQVDFDADQSRKCLMIAYSLHEWLVEKIGAQEPGRARKSDQGILATCTGRGDLTINQDDPDSAESSAITVKAAYTTKCREFLVDYLNFIAKV